jgi:hypothetical protein
METTAQRLQSTVGALSDDDRAVRALYENVLTRWNERNAGQLAALFERDATPSDSTAAKSRAGAVSNVK